MTGIKVHGTLKMKNTHRVNQELIRIKATDEKYSATYGVDITTGLYVQTLDLVEPSYNPETDQYNTGSSEEIDK